MNIDPSEWAQKTADLVKRTVANVVEPLMARIKALEEQPKPVDGLDGKDGAAGADGRDGVDGKDGAAGADGRDGAAATDEMVERAVAAWLKANPPAPGATGPAGERGEKGVDGRDGRDGLSGGSGPNGKDGRDGFSLNDLDLSLDADGRTVVLRFVSGDVQVEKRLKLATILDRGVYKAGTEYEAGDAVSFGGNMWIAQCKTTGKPGECADYRLAVKKGRDGKDGAAGAQGPQGAKGEAGRDHTQMLPNGRTY